MSGGHREDLREVLLNLNVPFAPEDFEHRRLRSSLAWHSPVIGRTILGPLERASSSDDAAGVVELCDWLLQNIQLPEDVKGQLCEAKRRVS